MHLPGREMHLRPAAVASRQWDYRRIAALHRMQTETPAVLLATTEALCQRCLPPQVLEQGPVMFASVKYNREVPKGESMEVFYAPSGQGWYITGRRGGHSAFECYLERGCGIN